MPLSIADSDNDAIYMKTNESLAYRIDFAWSVYQGKDIFEDVLRKKALTFLIEAFKLQNADRQKIPLLIAYLIQKRENQDNGKLNKGLVRSLGLFKANPEDDKKSDPKYSLCLDEKSL